MSDSTADLRRKIGGAKDLQSVVRTMKAVAASSIGQYEKSVTALNEYYHTVELGLGVCFRKNGTLNLAIARNSKAVSRKILAVVFGSDQGLVGQFNDLVADYAIKELAALSTKSQAPKAEIWAVGARVHARLTDSKLPLSGQFPVPNSVKAITPLVERILVETAKNERTDDVISLYLFYNRPDAGVGYAPVSLQLLPLDETWQNTVTELPWPTRKLPEIIGDQTETLRAFIRGYLFVSVFQACAESLAAENASRLASMQRAEKNINDLLEDLNGKFHRQRQSGIDEELFDVISSYEALNGEEMR